MRPLFCFLPILFASHLRAQDGGQLYATYCSACHGPDGKGVPAANSPPLSESPWVAGPPDRAVKVVLHGLEGPIEVLGKSYNLTMPPQGAVLPDDVVAAILTYVRSSFGNGESAVSADLVKSIRAETSSREKAWTAPEILKLHPLPKEPSALKNLISRTYFGNWRDLPDFSKLTSANVEEEHDGIISLDQATKRGEHFGMVWEADFEAEKDGDYEFYFDADDGGRVLINGKRIAEIKGLGPMNGSRSKTGQVKLAKGLHPIRIEFYEATNHDGIQLGWKGPGMKSFKWVSKDTASNTKKWPEILLTPKDRPIIYRNFIAGSTARAIGVGFPGGVNLVWSADILSPQLMWTGKFMDAGRHWTDRGQGNENPAGDSIVKLTNRRSMPDAAKFIGYQLDPSGNPTFRIRSGDQILTDAWKAQGATNGGQDPAALVRILTLEGGSQHLQIHLSDLYQAEPAGDGEYSLGGKIFIQSKDAPLDAWEGTTFLELTPGKPVTLRYRWKQ